MSTNPNRSNHRAYRFAAMRLSVSIVALLLLDGVNLRAASARVILTPAAGFTITWDGNNGGFSKPNAGAGPSNNVALASNGALPIGSSELAFQGTRHFITNINDGLYGNEKSWLSANGVGGNSDPDPWIGVAFPASMAVRSIAWGRDNGDDDPASDPGCGGLCPDRAVGIYTVQFTQVLNADATTPETGDAATGWASVATVEYAAGTEDASFTSYLRHRFEIAAGGGPVDATAVRLKVSPGTLAIDEIEVNPLPDPVPPISQFLEITAAPGFAISWDRNDGNFSTPATPAPVPANDASTARGATAFGSSQVDLGVHFIRNVNDGLYGNAHSWIPDFAATPDPAPFIGINFGRRLLLRNVAWGRDNGDVAGDCCGGTLTDRALGVYVLQITTVPNPGVATLEACGPTPEGGWVTVGTFNYKANNAVLFNSYLRHRFDVLQNGAPVAATGLRLKVPSNQSDIDEIEVNANVAVEQELLRITNAPGLSLTWDGNDGQFNDPAVGAAPPPNRALASQGTTPFTSSDLGPVLNIPFHRVENLNDGLYGNAHSWISANGVGGTSDPDPFAGLNFGGTVAVTNIAWGRDNGDASPVECGGTCVDRSLGTYRVQYTQAAAPDATTPETGDASTGWAEVGTVTYINAGLPFFTPYLRHRFDIASGGGPLNATGLRLKVSSGILDLDEIEVNTAVTAPPPAGPIGLNSAPGYTLTWDGNEGQFFDPAPGAAPPSNRALASQGSTPFTSSDLGPVLSIPFHRAANLNDGLYGNSHSWISANGVGGNADPDPFAGLNFNGTIGITNIAWSRDNGDDAEFIGTDRAVGTYTLQITTLPAPDATTTQTDDPATGWATLGTVAYRRAEPPTFTPHLRHRFDVGAGGAPIPATGLRIKVSDGTIDLDEIEVNTAAVRPLPHLNISRSGNNVVLSWVGGGGLEGATSVQGPWVCVADAVSPYSIVNPTTTRYYRIRR